MRIAVLGGTGREGRGLATRWAVAGHEVVIGSRDAARAEEAAREIADAVAEAARTAGPAHAGTALAGAANEEAARRADVVVLALPFEGLADTLAAARAAIGGRVVISAVVPMSFVDKRPVMRAVTEGSAAQAAAAALPEARVAAAFQTVDARVLADLGRTLDEDVPVATDSDEARAVAFDLCRTVGLRPIDAGPLAQAAYVEAVTPLLVGINRANRTHAGVRFTGLG